MKALLLCFFLLASLFLFASSSPAEKPSFGASDSIQCVTCVLVVRVVEQYALFVEPDLQKALAKTCTLLPPELQTPCTLFVALYGKQIIEAIAQKQNPDVVCQKIHFCKNPQCKLWKSSSSPEKNLSFNEKDTLDLSEKFKEMVMSNNWWHDFIERITRVFDNHLPAFDFDNDGFATTFGLRGSAWRGRDCDDNNRDVYPGRRVSNLDAAVDHNCNGIKGRAPSGVAYEDLLCNVTQRGIVVLGDSACAHFRIPQQWVLPQFLNKTTFSPLPVVLESEMDWPHMSSYTGFATTDTTKLTPGPIDSLYLRLRERNRCIHRDYQNICVNGARTGAMKNIIKSMSRNQKFDHPALVFYALVGNDVCSPHPEHYTTPEEFYNNVVYALDFLDTVLPPQSYVMMIGLAPGQILYDTLWNRTHPIGSTYTQLYDFLNCLGINPCWGWMNSNATARNQTTQRALELSAVYNKIIQDKAGVYQNFKMIYHSFSLDEVVEDYKKKGGDVADLIESMDGFHPSQLANALTAKYLYEDLEQNYPELLGPVNPNNKVIETLFGDQGGY